MTYQETLEELEQKVAELKDMVKDYEELLESAKEERDEYKDALIDMVDIGRKLV